MTAAKFYVARPEVVVPAWQTMARGARFLEAPLDIMIDIDEVLMPTVDEIHRLAFERGLHDGSRPYENWRGYEQYGCEPDVFWDLWSDFALADGYLVTAPKEGAAEGMRELYWAGHRLHIVTARGFMAHATQIREWTPSWLESFAIPFHTLTYAQDKVEAQGLIGAELGEPIGFDYAIDDSPRNYEALDTVGVGVYLHDHPHNAWFSGERRVANFGEFVDIILKEDA